MFLCRLNPSCPFSCSTVDPPWHFSAGAHEASCHWQTGTLQLKYPEETRDQRWLFSSPPSSVLVSTSLFFFNTSPFKVTGCSVVFSTQNILYILYTQSYWQRAWITTILFTTFISTGVTSEWSIVNWQCTTGNIIQVWLWSWFPLDIQTSPVMKSSSQFVIFVSAVMVTVWGQ